MQILFRRNIAVSLLVIVLCNNSVFGEEGERWSRQLNVDTQPEASSNVNDWVPLSEPCPTCQKGVALESGSGIKQARAVRYAQRDSAPAAQSHFQFVSDSFNNRFNFHHTHPQSGGTADVGSFSAPQPQSVNDLQPVPPFQFLPPSVGSPQKQIPLFVDQNRQEPRKPVMQHLTQSKPTFQFTQDEMLRLNMPQILQQNVQQPQSQQFIQPQQIPQFHHQPPQQTRFPQFQSQPQNPNSYQVSQQNPNSYQVSQQNPQEEVQLLYVPYNTLYNQQQQSQPPTSQFPAQDNRFSILNQPVDASLINDFYAPNTIPDIPTTRRPIPPRTTPVPTTPRPTSPFQFNQPKPTSTATKPKAHQPPLSMFLLNDLNGKSVSEKDALLILKKSNSIDVRDTVSDKAPKIFIGPSGMPAPKGYTKFELPYLSNIESTRTERRIEQMPFFVAPLSYRTPPGFSKIPLPAPHVGSVVINQPSNSIDEIEEANVITRENFHLHTKQPTRPSIGATVRIPITENTGQKEVHKITLTSGVNYRPPQPGSVEIVPLKHTEREQATPSTEYPTRLSHTPKKQEFYSTLSPSAPTRTPKVEYFPTTRQPNEYFPTTRQNDYFQSTRKPTEYFPSSTRKPTEYFPSSTRGPVEYFPSSTRGPLEYFPSSTRKPTEYFPSSTRGPLEQFPSSTRGVEQFPSTTKQTPTEYFPSTTRQPATRKPTASKSTTKKPYTFNQYEEEEKKISQDDYFQSKKPISSFKFGTLVEKPSVAQDFNFKPMPDLTFNSDSFEPTTTKPATHKSRQKEQHVKYSTTEAPKQKHQYHEETFGGTPKYVFPASTAAPLFEYSPTVSVNANNVNTDRIYTPHFENSFDFGTDKFENFKNRFNFDFNTDKVETQTDAVQDIVYSQPQNQFHEEVKEIKNFEETIFTTTTTEKADPLPSELPPINANLPGLVNSLMEEKWMQKNNIPETETTTQKEARRPPVRGRRPIQSAYRTTSTTESSDGVTTRRPINRGRRPTSQFTSRSPVYSESGTSPTSRTRNSNLVRNPNGVKFNGTGTDRKQLTRARLGTSNSKKSSKEEDNLDYQRDVLNQNYPSLRPVPSTTAKLIDLQSNHHPNHHPHYTDDDFDFKNTNIPTVDNVDVIPLSGNLTFYGDINENDRYYTPSQSSLFSEEEVTVTTTSTTTSTTTPEPATEKLAHNFLGLQEPMLIPQPQHKTQKHNRERTYENFYNPNAQFDEFYSSPTPKYRNNDDDYSYNTATTSSPLRTTTTSTTETPATKRTNFPRRRPTTYTTLQPDTYTTTTTETAASRDPEVYASRTKPRKEGVVVVKKIRQRVRTRPVATTEETVEIGNQAARQEIPKRVVNTPVRSRGSYQRTRPTTTTTEKPEEDSRPRFRIRENTGRFKFDQQESQWSTRLTQNSFQPFDEEKSQSGKTEFDLDDNQEIVTAGPVSENEENFLFNVSASVTPTKKVNPVDDFDTTLNMISTTESEIVVGKKNRKGEFEEPSFVKLMKDAFTEVVGDNTETPKAEQYIAKPDKKSTNDKKGAARRGVWKRVRVRPADAFETAESQNIGNSHLLNSLDKEQKKENSKDYSYEYHETVDQEKKNEKVSINEFTDLETQSQDFSTTSTPDTTTVVPNISNDEEEVPVIATAQVFGDLESTEVPESIEIESAPKQEKKSELIEVAKKALTELFHYASDIDDEEAAMTEEEFESELSTSTTYAPETITTTDTPQEVEKEEKSEVKVEKSTKKGSHIATSTFTEISHETEICYRGRCIKTDKTKK